MDAAPLEIHPAAVPLPRAARWIVAGTFALWIICFVVMAYMLWKAPAEVPPTTAASALTRGLGFAAIIPGVPAAVLGSFLPEGGVYICGIALTVAFTALEFLAWKRRLTGLAIALLVWLVVSGAFITMTVCFMALDND